MPNIIWPWGVGVQQDPNVAVETKPVYGPFQLPNLSDGEFAPLEFIQSAVSKVTANADRLFQSSKGDVTNVSADSPAWYNLPARIGQAASAINEGLQSTLLKVIVIVALIGVFAIFGLSYVQAKGQNLAK